MTSVAAVRLASKGVPRVPTLWSAVEKLHLTTRTKATQPSTAPEDSVVVIPTPESLHEEVLDHVTPIFLRDEPLSHSFPPCETGRRELDFRQYATAQLRSGLCMVATEGEGGPVIGCCLNRVLTRQDYGEDHHNEEAVGAAACLPEDPLVPNVIHLLTSVHRRLDLFTKMGVEQIFEIGLVAVEPSHAGKGIGSRLWRASLEMAAKRGLEVAKADCTGEGSAKVAVRCGMSVAARVPYSAYTRDDRVVFHNTGPGGGQHLTVVVARLQPQPPYVLPVDVSCFDVHDWKI